MYNQQEDSLESENMRKLFAGSLDRTTTDETFTNYFSQFGEVLNSMVIRDPNTKESRGCGFVTYANSDIIETILKGRPHVIDNKTLDVKRAIPKEFEGDAARTKTLRLFVGGFRGTDLTPEDLQQYLEPRHPTDYGSIEKIDFLKDKITNELKGFGFITCSSFDFADRLAIAEVSFTLKGKKMSIKKAEERDASQQKGPQGGGGPMRGGSRGGMRGSRGYSGGRGRGGGRGGGGYNNSYGGGYNNGGGYDDGYQQDNSYYQEDNYGGNNGGGGGGGGYNQNNSYYQQDNSNRGGGYGRGGSSWNRGSARYQPY